MRDLQQFKNRLQLENKPEIKKENKILRTVKRSDIYYANMGSGEGSEQSGIRPVVIIQNDLGNTYSPTVIVATITSQLSKAKLPTHVLIQDYEKYGLNKESVVLLEQLRTIDKKRLLQYVGTLDELMMAKVDRAMSISVDLSKKLPIDMIKIDRYIKNKIKNELDYIHRIESIIADTESAIVRRNLLEERQSYLDNLEEYCKNNGLNYRDFYVKYNKKDDKKVMNR